MTQRVNLQSLITLSVLSVGLVSGTVGLAYAYWHAKQSLQATVGITFHEIARQSADKAALLLGKEIEWLQRIAALPSIRASVSRGGQADQVNLWLEQWRDEQRQYFHSLVIVRADGQLAGGPTSEPTRVFYLQQSWWPVVFKEQRPWVGPFAADGQGRGYLEVVVPVGEAAEVAAGALKVILGTEYLLNSIVGSRIGRTGHVMLVGDDGSVLACSLLPPNQHRMLPGLLDRGNGAGRVLPTAALEADTHGKRGGIIGLAPVVLPAGIAQVRRWYVLVQQDPDETYEPLVELVVKLGLFGIGAVGLVGWLRWRLARRIVRPVTALIRRVNQFGETGDARPVVAYEPSGIQEIDTLAASFEDLARRLDHASRAKTQYVRRLEEANLDLATSEEHYRLLWDHSVDAKILLDPSGLVREINHRGEIALGRAASAMRDRPVSDFVDPVDRPRLLECVKRAIEGGEDLSVGPMQVPTPSGELTMEVDLVPVNKAGGIESVIMQLSDVTRRQELERQLLRSERLASLSQFASMFAHDIRNPLAGIKKTLEWLGRRPEMESDPARRCLEDLRFTTDLLLGMINDMLDVYQENYSGLPVSTSPVSLGALLNEVIHLFRSEADAQGVEFHLDVPPEELQVMGDGRRLQRVLINLVHNALKYSPPRGTIFLTVRRGAGAETTIIEVADQGPGIAPEDQPHLFEMFFKKKDGQDYRIGRGLGLHFCRLVIDAHGGRIGAANRAEGGAVFTIELPIGKERLCPSAF